MNKNFNTLEEGKWEEIINQWEINLEVELSKRVNKQNPRTLDPLTDKGGRPQK